MELFRKSKKVFVLLILFLFTYSISLFSQETSGQNEIDQPAEEVVAEETTIEENAEEEIQMVKKKRQYRYIYEYVVDIASYI